MPCRDYEDDGRWEMQDLRDQNDKLARIACKAMTALEEQGRADFLLLEDNEVREWWELHKLNDEMNGINDD